MDNGAGVLVVEVFDVEVLIVEGLAVVEVVVFVEVEVDSSVVEGAV